jgi:protein-L-isoaspartate O-methyltransferase
MNDAETLGYYASEARRYVSRLRSIPSDLSRFVALLPQGGKVLELGCGAGHDSAIMLEHGFDVTATDGSPEMAREAEIFLRRRPAIFQKR